IELVKATKRQSRSRLMSEPRVHWAKGLPPVVCSGAIVPPPRMSPGFTPNSNASSRTTTPPPPPIAMPPPRRPPPPPPICDGSSWAPSLYFTPPPPRRDGRPPRRSIARPTRDPPKNPVTTSHPAGWQMLTRREPGDRLFALRQWTTGVLQPSVVVSLEVTQRRQTPGTRSNARRCASSLARSQRSGSNGNERSGSRRSRRGGRAPAADDDRQHGLDEPRVLRRAVQLRTHPERGEPHLLVLGGGRAQPADPQHRRPDHRLVDSTFHRRDERQDVASEVGKAQAVHHRRQHCHDPHPVPLPAGDRALDGGDLPLAGGRGEQHRHGAE